MRDAESPVEIRLTGEGDQARAGFGNLQACGSVWACPVCSERINAERQAELDAGISRWVAQGNSIVFATFTIRHHGGQSLRELWDAIAPAWNRTAAGRAWGGSKLTTGDKQRFGIAGYAKVVEVKHSWKNGWHPHIHALLFIEGDISDSDIEELRTRMFGRWSKALGKSGYSALEFDKEGKAIGVNMRRVTDSQYLADYFAKNGYQPAQTTSSRAAAYEVTGSQSKRAGKGGRTPFQVLANLVLAAHERQVDGELVDLATGELLADSRRRDLGLWQEWETASRGRRQLTWSRGMRDLLGLGVEHSDEEIAEDDALQGVVLSLIGDQLIGAPGYWWWQSVWSQPGAEACEKSTVWERDGLAYVVFERGDRVEDWPRTNSLIGCD